MGYRKQNPLTVDGVLIADANKVTSSTSAVNRAVLTTGATGTPALTALATDGQLIIGSTAGAPAAASLTAGTGISITPGSNSITIAVSGSAVGETITGDTGGALSPTAGNWNFDANPSAGASVSFSGSGSTLTLNTSDVNNNTFVGVSSGNATLTSILSTGFGSNTLKALTNGNNNCGYGHNCLASLTSGSNNNCYGNSTGAVLLTGSSNLLMGSTGALGSGTQYTGAESSNIILSNVGTTGDSNIIRIGTQGSGNGQQNKCFIAGITGVSVSNLNVVTLNTSTGQLGSQAAANVGTVTQFDVLVGGAGGAIASVGPGSAGQVLQSGGAAANPAYSTATYPLTTTSQQILYSTAANVVGQLTTANSAIAATNSSGTLAMRAFSVVRQVFTGSGTYTPTAGMLYCDIICVGGGGAGGGAPVTSGAQFSAGGGGGAGEYAQGVFSAATIGASKTVTIGAAGTGNSGATGGNGGNSSVGSTLISANGGSGGVTTGAAAAGNVLGGAGGTGGTGGDFRTPGQIGPSNWFGTAGGSGSGGVGANGQYGSGGQTSVNTTGGAASGYGSGGGGVLNGGSQGAHTGGAGTAGIVIVTEYIIA